MEAEEEVVKEKSSLALSKEPPIILKTSFQKCPVCLIGTIVNTQEKSTLLIYGSFGVKVAEHQVHRCSNRNKLNPCRIGALYGYIIIDGEKIHTWMPLERISCGVKPNSIWKRLPYWGLQSQTSISCRAALRTFPRSSTVSKIGSFPQPLERDGRSFIERRSQMHFSSTPSLNMVKGMPSKAGKESRAAWRKQWWI